MYITGGKSQCSLISGMYCDNLIPYHIVLYVQGSKGHYTLAAQVCFVLTGHRMLDRVTDPWVVCTDNT